MAPLIHITEKIYLPTYLLIISLAYTLAIVWVYFRATKLKMEVQVALDFCVMIMVGGFLGARLFHVFYENFDYYRLFPMDIFKVWQGGFVFYGGLIGALAFCAIYANIKKLDFWKWGDFFAPILAFGYGFGRIGCLFNGCCYGNHCDLPWAIEFMGNGMPTGLRHPTQIYATAWEWLVVLPLLLFVIPKFKFPRTGYIFLSWLSLHAIGRLIMEAFRDDYRGSEIFGLSISAGISIDILVISLFLMWWWQRKANY